LLLPCNWVRAALWTCPGEESGAGCPWHRTQHNARFCAFKLLTAEREQTAMHLWDRWAGRPAIASVSVYHVQVVSSRVIPSRRRAAPGPVVLHVYYSARHAKGPLP